MSKITTSNNQIKIELHDTLAKECARILNISFDDNNNVIYDNDIMEWYDVETIPLSNSIPYMNDNIDAVLFFGDGTIEFHFEKECDAINWYYFPNNYIQLVIEEMKKINLKSYIELIKEFIRENGFCTFKQGFIRPQYEQTDILGVDNKFIYCGIAKILLDRVNEKKLKEIYESLQNHIKYCQTIA